MTLTVTDSSGLQSTTSYQIAVAGPPPPGVVTLGNTEVSGNTVAVTVTCTGAYACPVTLQLSVTETKRGGSVVAVSVPRKATKTTKKTVVVGAASLSLVAGQTSIIQVRLNRTGQQLLARFRMLTARLVATSGGNKEEEVTALSGVYAG